MQEINEIYDRQVEIIDLPALKFDGTYLVVGLGGVGSWVSLFLALVGCSPLVLVDYDTIEKSNLNRTPFRLEDIGKHKTEAIKELIKERRKDTIIYTYNRKLNPSDLNSLIKEPFPIVFDCSDTTEFKKIFNEAVENSGTLIEIAHRRYFKFGYDGIEMTLQSGILKPEWSNSTPYTIVPSFLVPPAYLGLTAVMLVLNKTIKYPEANIEPTTLTFNVGDVFPLFDRQRFEERYKVETTGLLGIKNFK